ncbi:hypothetical protein LF41_2563 [Lysobacter dokdonensis DS-58]|uniref:Transmembrane protein n=1 Tax=Lysobacter dokdonensis DS-58 TaxID=1300345 RepID=A0A0A2WMX7_9GAMM|nr:hypothetical protein [Lysobacter dokdonensis]KGQ19625.1 hypothetical protein LF41_2563 [Lysobacter dokdonensis DS-58]
MGKSILQLVLGILAGLVVMYVLISGIEFVSHQMYPPPPGLDPKNMEHLGAIMAAAPVGAMVMLVVAWAVGAFAGGWTAAKISRAWPRTAAIVVAVFVLLGVIGMILIAPGHPKWVAALGIVLPVPLALLGARFARPRVVLPVR